MRPSGASPNRAILFIRLKPYEVRTDRAQSAGAIIARLRPQMAAIKGAVAFPFNLPPILGLGSTGGFQYALEALQGQSPNDVAATLRGLVVAEVALALAVLVAALSTLRHTLGALRMAPAHVLRD